MAQADQGQPARIYGAAARHMHWITAAAVIVMVPAGLAMTYRGDTLNIWDATTNAMYSAHKLFGFLVLWLVAGRLANLGGSPRRAAPGQLFGKGVEAPASGA